MVSVLHLRAIVPKDRTRAVREALDGCPGATNVVILAGAAVRPAGDVVLADIARESANEVIDALRDLGVDRDGSIAVEDIDLSLSEAARRAEDDAPGYGEDAVVWEQLDRLTAEDARLTWSFVVFLVLATLLAGIAALIDSAVLVVGAMVLGPEFGAVAAICYGLIVRNPGRIGVALRTLAAGFAAAISVAYLCALAGRWTRLIEVAELPADRPQTAFIYNPDQWSFIVALLAGAAGVLSMTAGKSSALVGVFISVTTVPAAGNIAVALALQHWTELEGSVVQLLLNLAGMIIAGVVTLLLQKVLWSLVPKKKRQTVVGPTTEGGRR
jgi:uncharacterized hydrophobic protein (TIGR00271 family)